MHILLAFITDSPEIKANQSQTSYKIVAGPTPSCVLSAYIKIIVMFNSIISFIVIIIIIFYYCARPQNRV